MVDRNWRRYSASVGGPAQRVGERDDGVAVAEQATGDGVPAAGVGEGAVDEHDGGLRCRGGLADAARLGRRGRGQGGAGEQEDAGQGCDEQAEPAWAVNGHEDLLGSETGPCSVGAFVALAGPRAARSQVASHALSQPLASPDGRPPAVGPRSRGASDRCAAGGCAQRPRRLPAPPRRAGHRQDLAARAEAHATAGCASSP